MIRTLLFCLACIGLASVISSAAYAAAPLIGTPCATGTHADASVIGQTLMDNDQTSVIACLYSDTSHNSAPNVGVWKSSSGILGPSSTNTSPYVANDVTTGLFTPGPGQVAVSTAGIQRFVVDQNGNIGIATPNPISPLQITSSNPLIGSMGFGAYWGDMWFNGGNDGYFPFVNTSGLATGGTAFVRNPNFSGNIIPLFYIGNNGNVGVGTEVPQATLDVNGYARLRGNTSAPAACTASNFGSIALNHLAKMCICDGTSWNFDSTGAACTW